MASIFIKTYGCVANRDNEAIILGLLAESGFNIVSSFEEADIIIINTCTVKGVTENKILGELRMLRDNLQSKKVIITGCMPGAQEKFLKKQFPNFSLLSTQNTTKIIEVINKILKNETVILTAKNKEIKLNLPKLIKSKTTAIQISEGCADSCTFCITKLAKGRIYSFPKEKIIEDIKQRLNQGVTTFHLTSQDNGAYGLDASKTSRLAELLKEIINIEGNFKIRVGMMNPKHILPILDELIAVFKDKKIMRFAHIPVQSGSGKVLKEMNRNSTVEDFKLIVKTFRKEIPDIDIATDIIVGYPTETEKDFQETVQLVKDLKFEVLNLSKFASRPGTPASKLKKLITEEIKRRSTIIHDIYWKQRYQ